MSVLRWLVYHALGLAIAFDTLATLIVGARNWV